MKRTRVWATLASDLIMRCLASVFITCLLVVGSHIYALGQEPIAPVIFIPGFIGSKLEDDQGVIWGDLFNTVQRFSDLELPVDPQQNRLRATTILDTMHVFGPFFKIGQYIGLLKYLEELGFREGKNLFPFAYDWRQSNFESAARLQEFITALKAKGLVTGKVNIVAHSMGGIVALIYIQKHGGAAHVDRLVTMGTPHLGTLEALRTLLLGWGNFKNFILGGEALVKRVAFSFPSLYEVMATYPNCCILGHPDLPREEKRPIDLLDLSLWRRSGWIPSEYGTSPRREFLERAFARASELRTVLGQELPPGLRLFKVAGDLINTVTRVYFDREARTPIRWDRYGGDGTVPVVSATRNDQADAFPAIQMHSTIFNDRYVQLQLKRILTLDKELIEKYAFRGTTAFVLAGPKDDLVPLGSLEIRMDDAYQEIGRWSSVQISIHDDGGRPVSGVRVRAWLERARNDGESIAVVEAPAGDYVGSFIVPTMPGTYRVFVDVPGIGLFEDYFAALSATGR